MLCYRCCIRKTLSYRRQRSKTMNPNRLNRAGLADMAKNTAVQVAAGKVTGLLPEQVVSISAAIAGAADELAAADQRQVATIAAAHEATRIAQEKRLVVLRLQQD